MNREIASMVKRGIVATIFACLEVVSASAMDVTANSLAELRAFGLSVNNSTVTLSPTGGDPHPVTGVVTPGEYWINGDHIANPTNSMPIFMDLRGTGNTYDLSGATINLDTRKLDGYGRALGHDSGVDVIQINGSGNTVRGLTLIGQDIALDTNPGAQRYADWATQYVELSGVNNTVDGAHVVTRGSRTDTYGLSDAFGKGASQGISPFIGHRKASAFRVGEATNATVNDMHLEVNTFGHGFFVQASTNTTLTNSTVTGELFSSQLVVDRPEYQQHGHTWWGEPIPNDIMLSGAEGGVRMYNGASGLTVDNVVVTNMRTGFATVHAGGDVNISNAFARGTTSGFDVGNNTTISNSGGDIINGPLLVFYTNSAGNSTIELELEGGTPVGTNWSAAYLNGNNVDLTISSDLPAGDLPEESLVRLGQSYFENWRNFDYNSANPESGNPIPLTNSTFTNNTNQLLFLGDNAEGNSGSSQSAVITNGKNNSYDGISLVPSGKRTTVVHSGGLGNNGTSSDGSLDSNATIVESGGTLEIQPGIGILNEKLTISGNGVDGLGALYSDGQVGSSTRFGSSNGRDQSTIFLDGNASIGVGVAGNQLLVGSIQGTGNFTKRGPGILSIEKASTFDGDFSVTQGEVVARSNVVNGRLTIGNGASLASIGDNAINTSDTVFLFGTMDINARSDDNNLTSKTGQLFGPGAIRATNTAASQASTLTIEILSSVGLFTGQIQDNINLVKTGAGTQALSGTNTYTGTTTISDGLLQIDGTHTGGGAYAVEAGGTLGGVGDIGSTVVVQAGGVLSPGASAGELTIDSVELQTDSTLELELESSSQYDSLTVNDITLGGQLAVSLIGSGFMPTASDLFTVASASSLVGAFDNVLSGARLNTLGGEGSFLVSYDSVQDSVVLSDFLISGLTGDFNNDGAVDSADYTLWRDTLGTTGITPFSGADATGDGNITTADYLEWRNNFGASSLISTATTNVPEPASFVILLIATLCLSTSSRSSSPMGYNAE